MAITQAPLLSLSASGSIGKTVTYDKWKGRKFARAYAVPTGPRTGAQALTREIFGWLTQVWVDAPALFKEPYQVFAKHRPFQPSNVFLGKNIRLLRGLTDINSIETCPGVNGGPGLNEIGVAPAGTSVTVIMGVPAAPPGWAFAAKIGIVIRAQNPLVDMHYKAFGGEQLSPSSNVNVTGLTNLTEYVCTGYLRWVRPDGSTAYTRSVNKNATTT